MNADTAAVSKPEARLNDAQRQAVTAGDGPVLVLAGAGSGKTRVIVERMVWLVEERGIDPRHLLALTFTNRAANEMKARVAARIGVERLAAWVGTFHAFGLYVLRREIERLGRPKAFTVFDDTDQLSLMKRLIKALPASAAKVSPRDAIEWISHIKQDVGAPDADEGDGEGQEATYRRLWGQYHEALRQASALDFDDLLVLLVQVLERHTDVRERYQQRYRHMLVDEYQDTNRAQYRIAKLLSGGHGNVFAVGDEDQSIYSWRGANIQNIVDFEKDFPGAQVFRLEQNYRSTAAILNVANAVVVQNKNRLGKTLWTSVEAGAPVRFYLAKDGPDEARFVVEDVALSKADPREVAILYRANWQSRVLEETLRAHRMPHVVVGGIRFYNRKEIKDILCYLRLLVNPSDDESVRRVINVPARAIGNVTMQRLEDYAAQRAVAQRAVPLMQVIREVEHDQTILPRAREALNEFAHLIDDLTLKVKTSGLCDLTQTLLERTQYRAYVKASDEKDFRSRIEVIDEFVVSCTEFDAKQQGGLLEFLQDLALYSEADDWDTQTAAVTLMTCHSAKGLEFDNVYLVGLEEGLLPHAMSTQSDRDIEEERRLCYVAMTRARKRLTLTAAESRSVYGETHDREVSRFVNEIPQERLEVVTRKPPETRGARPPAARAESGPLRLGTKVFHPKFGAGSVVYTSGSGGTLRARIRFHSGRVGTFMISKTPLQIVEDKKR